MMNTEHIWTDPGRCSGKPCLRGRRMPIAQILTDISYGRSIQELSDNFNIPIDLISGMLTDLAEIYNCRWASDD